MKHAKEVKSLKKLIFICILLFSVFIGITVNAEDVLKIQQDGVVKRAKEFGSGNGIEFTLPALSDPNFVVDSIELAVFEKKEAETEYKIFGASKIIENAALKIAFDFGDISRFKEGSKYKIVYRYYVRAIDDLSKLEIAGLEIKEGWRLVGEAMPTKATDNGFSFYLNSKPTVSINSISYDVETISGITTLTYTKEQLKNIWLPSNAFSNGVTVNYIAQDADLEDTLTVKYRLKDAVKGEIISEGFLPADGKIICDVDVELVELSLLVNDNWGIDEAMQSISFAIDKEAPFVYKQFDDKGKYIRGRNLYSKFTIHDSQNEALSGGNVYYTIKRNGTNIFADVKFINNSLGEYIIDLSNQADGVYDITLTMFDKANNKAEHTLTLKLDNTTPSLSFLTPNENSTATQYSAWMNQSKNILIKATDQYAGIKQINYYLDYSYQSSIYTNSSLLEQTFNISVTNSKTGKLFYYFYIYDNAVTINKANNTVNTSSAGNWTFASRYVWLDKKAPTVAINADENTWYQAPTTITAVFYDYESSVGASDNSGVMSKYYAIMDTQTLPTNWLAYTGGVSFNTGGVYYLYIKAVDYAGNETVTSKKIKVNTPSTIISQVSPTADYVHTIYNSTNGIYVIKNTAYNTRYHFNLRDEDIDDTIKVNIRLVNEDDNSIYAEATMEVLPNGGVNRDIAFNLNYIKVDNSPLPDGVYTMYITINELKGDGSIITSISDEIGCEVVIKRLNPPSPIIEVEDVEDSKTIVITYPDEILSNSLKRDYIKALYKREYKIVMDKEADSNSYKTYVDKIIDIKEDCIVTALYTDPAGNLSTATMRVFANSKDGKTSIKKDGNKVSIEETRPTTIYYIGTRRDKQGDIDSTALKFVE